MLYVGTTSSRSSARSSPWSRRASPSSPPVHDAAPTSPAVAGLASGNDSLLIPPESTNAACGRPALASASAQPAVFTVHEVANQPKFTVEPEAANRPGGAAQTKQAHVTPTWQRRRPTAPAPALLQPPDVEAKAIARHVPRSGRERADGPDARVQAAAPPLLFTVQLPDSPSRMSMLKDSAD